MLLVNPVACAFFREKDRKKKGALAGNAMKIKVENEEEGAGGNLIFDQKNSPFQSRGGEESHAWVGKIKTGGTTAGEKEVGKDSEPKRHRRPPEGGNIGDVV